MGKFSNGLRRWWQSLEEFAYETAILVLENVVYPVTEHVIKPAMGLLPVAEFLSFMRKEKTEREADFLTAVFSVAVIAVAIAARCAVLSECLVGVAVGVWLIWLWCKNMARRSGMRSAVANDVENLNQSMANEHKAGYERVEWLNKLVRKAWPYVVVATEQARPDIRDYIEPILEEYRLGMYQVIREQPDEHRVEKYIPVKQDLTALHVNNLLLGDVPPVIEGLKINELKDGNVRVHLRLSWKSDAQVTFGVGTPKDAAAVPMVLENLKILARVRFTLQVTETPPFITAVVATLPLELKPTFDYTIRVIGGSNTNLPKLNKHVQTFATNVIADRLLWPRRFVLPNSMAKDVDLTPLYLELHGQLSVTVIRGLHLVNLYPYVTVFCRSKFKMRTKSIENTHDPLWNEEFVMDVEDKDSQQLVLQVMNEKKGADEFVGLAVYPLKNLAEDKDVELELHVQPRKKSKWSRNTDESGQMTQYGKLFVELRYHVHKGPEKVLAALKAEEELEKALAAPDDEGSYEKAVDLMHSY